MNGLTKDILLEITNPEKQNQEDFKILIPRDCLILNPYTKSLRFAKMEQTAENWKAILGTDNIGEYEFNSFGERVIFSTNIWNKLTGSISGIQFKGWKRPFFGMLIFVGRQTDDGETLDLSPEGLEEIEHLFEKGKVQTFKFSS